MFFFDSFEWHLIWKVFLLFSIGTKSASLLQLGYIHNALYNDPQLCEHWPMEWHTCSIVPHCWLYTHYSQLSLSASPERKPAVCTDIVHNCVNDASKLWRSAVTIKQSINSLWMPLLCPTVYIQSKCVVLQGPEVRPV